MGATGCGIETAQQKMLSMPATAASTSSGRVLNVVILGDSQSICHTSLCGTGPEFGKRWPDLLAAELTAKYGSHGTGMVPLVYSVGVKRVNADAWTVSGGWDFDVSIGPQQSGRVSGSGLVRLEDGAVATFAPNQMFDHLRTYCAADHGTGSLIMRIDGEAVGTACALPAKTVTAKVATSRAVSLGVHRATFTCVGQCLLYAVEGTAGNSGVSVHNVSVGSAAAEWFGAPGTTGLAFTDLIPGGIQVAIMDLLTNDPGVGYSTDSYGRAMSDLLEHERAMGAKVLAVVPPVSRIDAIAQFPEYTEALLAVAKDAAVVNIQDSWGTTFDPSSGYWSSDEIHPNTAGSLAEYQLIQGALVIP